MKAWYALITGKLREHRGGCFTRHLPQYLQIRNYATHDRGKCVVLLEYQYWPGICAGQTRAVDDELLVYRSFCMSLISLVVDGRRRTWTATVTTLLLCVQPSPYFPLNHFPLEINKSTIFFKLFESFLVGWQLLSGTASAGWQLEAQLPCCASDPWSPRPASRGFTACTKSRHLGQ